LPTDAEVEAAIADQWATCLLLISIARLIPVCLSDQAFFSLNSQKH
jgi:hypothetical protein